MKNKRFIFISIYIIVMLGLIGYFTSIMIAEGYEANRIIEAVAILSFCSLLKGISCYLILS